MVRLSRLTTHLLIVLATIEGSVAHLAHSDHCLHGDEQVAGDSSHVHASTAADEPTFALVSAVGPTEEFCLACTYLAQRAGLGPVADRFELFAAVEVTRPIWSRVDPAAASGGHGARAPPVLG